MSTPYAEAVQTFRDSSEFKSCSDPRTIGAEGKQRQYLENRLLRAFAAGWNARGADNGSENSRG